jgi:hypothetical protein
MSFYSLASPPMPGMHACDESTRTDYELMPTSMTQS